MLANSNYGQNIQENINAVVTDGKFNDALVRHVLDEKIKGVFNSSTPLSVTFKDAKILDVQNPIIGNIISQVNVNQIGEKGVKVLFARAEDEKIRRRLEALKRRDNEDGGEGGSGSSGQAPPPPPTLPPQTLPSPPTFSPTFSPTLPGSPPSSNGLIEGEDRFFGTESLKYFRNDFWNSKKFETEYSKPIISLTGKAENSIEMIPKLKKENQNLKKLLSQMNCLNFSKRLTRK